MEDWMGDGVSSDDLWPEGKGLAMVAFMLECVLVCAAVFVVDFVVACVEI